MPTPMRATGTRFRTGQLAALAITGACLAACSAGTNATPESSQSLTQASRSAPSSQGIGTVRAWLAYQTIDGATDRVHLVHLDASGDHAIAPELPGRTAHPDFSSDGRHLTFDQLADPTGSDPDQVYVARPDGTHPRLVAPCRPPACLDQWEPAWSPDGRHIVVSSAGGRLSANGPTRFGLAVIDVATQQVTPILEHSSRQGQDHFARWSPDGSALVFWREQATPDGSIRTAVFRIDANGHNLRQLTPWPMLAGEPDWAPDGSSIVFCTHPLLTFDGQGESELFLMNPDGTNIRQVTRNGATGPRTTQPRWTPDGTAILYTQVAPTGPSRYVRAIRPDGTGDTDVLSDRSIYTHPELQPTP